jgi:hypothetical protein
METQHEQWKAIAECNGEYYISDHGQVKSYKFGKEKIIKPTLQGKGYLKVEVYVNGQRKMHKIHRLVAKAFIENTQNKPEVNHKDCNKTNNHILNLEWATGKENMKHALDMGVLESRRLSVIKANSKKVVDITNGKKYNSLKLACIYIGEPYRRHQKRIHQSSKLQRFFYIDDNGNG